MSFSVFRRYELQCSHRLTKVPPTHKCANLHGHNFSIEIHVEAVGEHVSSGGIMIPHAALDEQGFVVDYDVLDEAWAPTFKMLDHQTLNDFIDNPTSEEVARFIYARVAGELRLIQKKSGRRELRITHVVVLENQRSGAVYRP